jgi:hypothetical protein
VILIWTLVLTLVFVLHNPLHKRSHLAKKWPTLSASEPLYPLEKMLSALGQPISVDINYSGLCGLLFDNSSLAVSLLNPRWPSPRAATVAN